MAPVLKIAHFISPALTRNITARVMSAYFKYADPSPATNGNLFTPLEYGTSIHGGWNLGNQAEKIKKRVTIASVLALGIAAGFYLVSKKNSDHT